MIKMADMNAYFYSLYQLNCLADWRFFLSSGYFFSFLSSYFSSLHFICFLLTWWISDNRSELLTSSPRATERSHLKLWSSTIFPPKATPTRQHLPIYLITDTNNSYADSIILTLTLLFFLSYFWFTCPLSHTLFFSFALLCHTIFASVWFFHFPLTWSHGTEFRIFLAMILKGESDLGQ